jgi:arabinofuranosyltransferase
VLWLAPTAWAALATTFLVRLGSWAPDDFYITYRYARNLAGGDGFVYNAGERVFGTTDPGVGLLLAAGHAATGIDVPWLAAGLFALGLVSTATLLLVTAARERRIEALIGGTLLVASSVFWRNQGAAAPLLLAVLVAAAALAPRRPALAGLLGGAAAWLRPDAALALPLLALLRWRAVRRPSWPLLAAGVAIIATGLAAAWWYFGAPLPNTLGAKLDMATAARRAASAFWQRAAATQLPYHFGDAWPLVGGAGFVGAVAMLRRGSPGERLVAAYGIAIAVAYTLLGVPFFGWYLLPTYAALLYGVAWAAAGTARWAGRLAGRPAASVSRSTAVPPATVAGPATATAGVSLPTRALIPAGAFALAAVIAAAPLGVLSHHVVHEVGINS